jgi:hypothetical protein
MTALESNCWASYRFFLSTSASVTAWIEAMTITVVEACTVPKGSAFTKMNPLATKMLTKKSAKNSFLCTVSPHNNIGLFS